MKNYKIAVAGTGYVGLSIATLLSQVRLSMRYLPPAELNSNPTEAAWDY